MGILGVPSREPDAELKVLCKVLEQHSVARHMPRLRQQAMVLLWGAYETFARDVFIQALNSRPALFGALLKSPLKDRFQTQQIFSYAALEQHGFSLEKKLGSAVADGRDFSSPALLRVLFQHLFSGVEDEWAKRNLAQTCEAPELWLLGHRRHVIAHRAGLVDDEYIRQTGDHQQVGEMLAISNAEIDRALWAVARVSGTLVVCSSHLGVA